MANKEATLIPSRACSDLVTMKAVEEDVEGTFRRMFSAYLGRKIDKGMSVTYEMSL